MGCIAQGTQYVGSHPCVAGSDKSPVIGRCSAVPVPRTEEACGVPTWPVPSVHSSEPALPSLVVQHHQHLHYSCYTSSNIVY